VKRITQVCSIFFTRLPFLILDTYQFTGVRVFEISANQFAGPPKLRPGYVTLDHAGVNVFLKDGNFLVIYHGYVVIKIKF